MGVSFIDFLCSKGPVASIILAAIIAYLSPWDLAFLLCACSSDIRRFLTHTEWKKAHLIRYDDEWSQRSTIARLRKEAKLKYERANWTWLHTCTKQDYMLDFLIDLSVLRQSSTISQFALDARSKLLHHVDPFLDWCTRGRTITRLSFHPHQEIMALVLEEKSHAPEVVIYHYGKLPRLWNSRTCAEINIFEVGDNAWTSASLYASSALQIQWSPGGSYLLIKETSKHAGTGKLANLHFYKLNKARGYAKKLVSAELIVPAQAVSHNVWLTDHSVLLPFVGGESDHHTIATFIRGGLEMLLSQIECPRPRVIPHPAYNMTTLGTQKAAYVVNCNTTHPRGILHHRDCKHNHQTIFVADLLNENDDYTLPIPGYVIAVEHRNDTLCCVFTNSSTPFKDPLFVGPPVFARSPNIALPTKPEMVRVLEDSCRRSNTLPQFQWSYNDEQVRYFEHVENYFQQRHPCPLLISEDDTSQRPESDTVYFEFDLVHKKTLFARLLPIPNYYNQKALLDSTSRATTEKNRFDFSDPDPWHRTSGFARAMSLSPKLHVTDHLSVFYAPDIGDDWTHSCLLFRRHHPDEPFLFCGPRASVYVNTASTHFIDLRIPSTQHEYINIKSLNLNHVTSHQSDLFTPPIPQASPNLTSDDDDDDDDGDDDDDDDDNEEDFRSSISPTKDLNLFDNSAEAHDRKGRELRDAIKPIKRGLCERRVKRLRRTPRCFPL